MKQDIRKEACVESLEEALEAEQRGAHQIELCSNLSEEGLTPSAVLIQECLNQLSITVKVMVRPRAGSFVCDTLDLGDMVTDIKMMKNLGVQEIVLGVTTPENTIDVESLKLLLAHAGEMQITFHKAIDTCDDPIAEVGRLVELGGVHNILTSGGSSTAYEGITNLKAMSKVAGDKLQVIAAGSITDKNVDSLHENLQLSIYHGRKIMGDLNTSKK